ncbi:MAG: hypothetical protein M0Q52_11100 [Lascolabacillus sp.]|nr:hypothetical protein [Lascolabacillus sp.]
MPRRGRWNSYSPNDALVVQRAYCCIAPLWDSERHWQRRKIPFLQGFESPDDYAANEPYTNRSEEGCVSPRWDHGQPGKPFA